MRQVITQHSRIAWKSEKGLTLVEVMIAITLIGLVAASILMSYNLSYRIARINTHRTQAIQIAQATIEAERDLGFRPAQTMGALSWAPTSNNPYLGNTGNMMTDVVVTDSPIAPPFNIRIIDVTVGWTEGGTQSMTETLTTAVVRQ